MSNFRTHVTYILKICQFLSKIFFPLIAPGEIQHAILGVVEFDNQDSVHISIIDSFGENSAYQRTGKAFAEGLQEAFSSFKTEPWSAEACLSFQKCSTACPTPKHLFNNRLEFAKILF